MLNTYNPDRLISISTRGTFNLRINAQSLHYSYFSPDQLKIKQICRTTKECLISISTTQDLFLIRLYLGKVWGKLWIILEKNSNELNTRTEIYQKFTSTRHYKNSSKFLQINIRSIIYSGRR